MRTALDNQNGRTAHDRRLGDLGGEPANLLPSCRVRNIRTQRPRPQRAVGWRRWLRPRWVLAVIGIAAVVVAAFLIIGNGSAPPSPRTVTADEASRLAITRFRNYQASGRAVTITVPSAGGGLVIVA